jgi:DNA-binding transcriptional MerR regulator
MAEYTISELSEISGVNRRNIHFYVQQGLLPPPEGAGLAARYSDEHLQRLRAIPVLRNRGLRLDEIRSQLGSLGRDDLEKLIAHPPPVPPVRDTVPPQPPTPQAQALSRYVLAPGVELLVDAGAQYRDRQAIEALIREARRLFAGPYLHSNGGQS